MHIRDVFLTKVATAAFIDEMEKQGGIGSVLKGLWSATKNVPKVAKGLGAEWKATKGTPFLDRIGRMRKTEGVSGALKDVGRGAILPAAGLAALYGAGKGIGSMRRRHGQDRYR